MVAVFAAAGAALIAMALVNPVAAIVTGLATLAALLVPRGRTLLTLGPAVLLALSAAYVIQVQLRHGLPSDGEWVRAFGRIATVSWIAVLLLGADVLVTALGRRYRHDVTAGQSGQSGPGTGTVAGGDAARPTVHP